MCAWVNWFVVKNICPMMVNSSVELLDCKSNVLLVTLLTCYQVDEVAGSTAEVVSDCECASTFRRSEVFTAVEVLAGDTPRVVASFCPGILYVKLW